MHFTVYPQCELLLTLNFLDCRAENFPSRLCCVATNKGLRAEMAKLLLPYPANVRMEL